jgi:hypothetical protein
MIFPLVLGRGKRVFGGCPDPGALELKDHFVSAKGVIFLNYEPAGDVPTGSFATKEPSNEELARRSKMNARK